MQELFLVLGVTIIFNQFPQILLVYTKSTSSDATFDIVFDFTKKKNDIAKVKAFDYIVCTYDRKCWIGMVNQIDAQCEDLLVNYMHPSFPSRSFHWPIREDKCWIPNFNVVCVINAPKTVTGRQYNLQTSAVTYPEAF